MKLLSIGISSALALALFAATPAAGFGLTTTPSYNHVSVFGTRTTATFASPRLSKTLLHGILDDISSESSSTDEASTDNDAAYEQLFEDLVFSTRDSRVVIAEQLEACTDAGFVQYLEALEGDSTDDEERQALRDLLDAISDVKATTEAAAVEAAKQAELLAKEEAQRLEDEAKAEANAPEKVRMSTAEVLKKANEIDAAMVTAEASDDELPDDFMRDAKATVGLTEFNNKGQMRVGGR